MSKILDKIVLRDTKTGISTEYTIQDTQLKERVEHLIANKNDTNGNSELIDIRTGFDGSKYDTAGDAVRSQVSNLQEQVNDINNNGLIFNDDYISLKIDTWLKDHPEATTTVLDNSITKEKIEENFLYDLRKARFYNSVADMKVDSELKAGQVCKTLGYYSTNDGGGAYYVIRAKQDSDVDDGGSVHELASGLIAELIIENGTVNVKQFGAKGDGVADDTQAIQTAVNKIKSVYIPKGKYAISEPIKLKTYSSIVGEYATSIISINKDINAVILENDNAFITIKNLYFTVGDDVTSTKTALEFIGSATADFIGARYSVFKNIIIRNFYNGLAIAGAWCSSFYNIRTISITKYGLKLLGTCNDLSFYNCQFTDCETGVFAKPLPNYSFINGIVFVNIDVEKNTTLGFDMSGIVGLFIDGLYSEKTPRIINCNSCAMVSIKNIICSGLSYFGSFNNTEYSQIVYKGSINIENAKLTVSEDVGAYLAYGDDKIERINCKDISIISSTDGEVVNINFLQNIRKSQAVEHISCKEYKNISNTEKDYILPISAGLRQQFRITKIIIDNDNSQKSFTVTINNNTTLFENIEANASMSKSVNWYINKRDFDGFINLKTNYSVESNATITVYYSSADVL